MALSGDGLHFEALETPIGRTYLLYAVAGESGIAIAELTFP